MGMCWGWQPMTSFSRLPSEDERNPPMVPCVPAFQNELFLLLLDYFNSWLKSQSKSGVSKLVFCTQESEDTGRVEASHCFSEDNSPHPRPPLCILISVCLPTHACPYLSYLSLHWTSVSAPSSWSPWAPPGSHSAFWLAILMQNLRWLCWYWIVLAPDTAALHH
jgi:hypothetical protein